MSLVLEELSADPLFLDPIVKFKPKAAAEKDTYERIAIVGLGYVGLPLATRLAYQFEDVVGFDICTDRIDALQQGVDRTNEIETGFLNGSGLKITSSKSAINNASFYIVTVPTPITENHQPDLGPLRSACRTIASYLNAGDVVVFESTVYPGVTEDICGQLLADLSGLRLGVDFSIGYSPERVNPGDTTNTIEKVTKVVAGQNEKTQRRIADVYKKVVPAGLFLAPSIKVAEAAKVLENVQRDVNIALMNEVSLICDKIGIKSKDVIDAASTKWNFARYEPGLVGGHCIGVDPYYLASLADQVGLHPEVILAGRRVNDGMVGHVADQIIRILIETGQSPSSARIGIFGIAFKEDVPDLRNSKAIGLIKRLWDYGLDPMVSDPHCDPLSAQREGIYLSNADDMNDLDLLVVTCPHRVYRQDTKFLRRVRKNGGIVDIKGAFATHANAKKHTYWSL